MEWNKIYITGIGEIDLQHRELFDIINNFTKFFSDEKKYKNEEIETILKFLVNYSMFHFTSEEEYMKRINYKDLQLHKKIHEGFILEVRSIIKTLEISKTYEPKKLYDYLMSWLKIHVAKEDQEYVKAGGKIKALKTTMLDKCEIIDILTPNLSMLELLFKDGLMSKNDRDIKRKKYLHTYYDIYKTYNLSELYILLESSSLLSEKKYISTEEYQELEIYICSKVNIQKLISLETNKGIETKVKEYLSHNNLI